MSTPRLRHLVAGVVTTAVAAGVAVTAAPAASAAPAFTGGRVAVGDLTGDGVKDEVSIGYLGPSSAHVCGYRIAPGLGSGQFGTPVTGRLPVRNNAADDQLFLCPDLGVVLRGPNPALNALAVSWFDFGPIDAPRVQTFRGFATGAVRNAGGFEGAYQPSTLTTQDFDGDGYGDVIEQTDQGTGTTIFVGRGPNWHQLWTTPGAADVSDLQYFDLNHNGGTDIVTTSGSGFGGVDATVVDGRTGAEQVLATADDDPDTDESFLLTVIDVNHDALPDLLLQTFVSRGGDDTRTAQQFVNRSGGGRWYFAPGPVRGG